MEGINDLQTHSNKHYNDFIFQILFSFTDLLTIEPHTPSPEPKKYHKNGGDWNNNDAKETKGTFLFCYCEGDDVYLK